MFREMAAAEGRNVFVQEAAEGKDAFTFGPNVGNTPNDHLSNQDSLNKIQQNPNPPQKWNYVILQDQSRTPLLKDPQDAVTLYNVVNSCGALIAASEVVGRSQGAAVLQVSEDLRGELTRQHVNTRAYTYIY